MKNILTIVLLPVLTGCATRGANYVPLVDLQGRSQETFTKDTTECQAFAKTRLDAAQSAVVMAIVGALIGAAIAPSGYRSGAASYGAGIGALSGASTATDTQESITKRCLAGRGYSVLN